MSRRGMRAVAVAAALTALLAFGGEGRAARAAEIAFLAPAPGSPVFGTVEVQVARPAVLGPGRVELFLDGRRAGSTERAPYRFVVDVGQGNVEHRFEAIAYDAAGRAVASAELRTPRIATDLEIDVRLRQLYVTVSTGELAREGLGRDDFSVFEQGAPQRIVTFERGDVPFSAVLLVDASASMAGERLATALSGARAFAAAMQPLDEAKLLLFSDRLLLETPFSSVPAILELALAEARARGGTALNDALFVAHRRLAARSGRRVLILLSDGGDVESVLEMAEVARAFEREPAALYWLRLRREEERRGPIDRTSIWRDVPGHRREIAALERAVRDSGGRIVPIDALGEIAAALSGIVEELRGQYVLGFYSTIEGEAAGRDVRVEVKGGGRVRIQRGTAP